MWARSGPHIPPAVDHQRLPGQVPALLRKEKGDHWCDVVFRVTIVAEAFRGVSAVACHRLVYAAVDDMLKTDIHALAIEASPPSG